MATSALCRSFATANQQRRATALRVMLEAYDPFVKFRERLIATEDASKAARQTKQLLTLDAHPEDIKETLISLGQFSQALVAEGGGLYKPSDKVLNHSLQALADGCSEDAAAERHIRTQLGDLASSKASRSEVIIPLSTALQKAMAGDPRGAVVQAGNAIESFLEGFASRNSISLSGKHGINSKSDELKKQRAIPTKVQNISKMLGHIRNAADHGIDPEVGASWEIRDSTGLEYVYVALSFISSVTDIEMKNPPKI